MTVNPVPTVFEANFFYVQSNRPQLLISEMVYTAPHIGFKLDFCWRDHCKRRLQTFCTFAHEAWLHWASTITEPWRAHRNKRDTGSPLGGIGTGLGVMNSVNTEIIMNKLSHANKQLREVERPITTSTSDMGHQVATTADLLPVWHQIRQLEGLLVIRAMEKTEWHGACSVMWSSPSMDTDGSQWYKKTEVFRDLGNWY